MQKMPVFLTWRNMSEKASWSPWYDEICRRKDPCSADLIRLSHFFFSFPFYSLFPVALLREQGDSSWPIYPTNRYKARESHFNIFIKFNEFLVTKGRINCYFRARNVCWTCEGNVFKKDKQSLVFSDRVPVTKERIEEGGGRSRGRIPSSLSP